MARDSTPQGPRGPLEGRGGAVFSVTRTSPERISAPVRKTRRRQRSRDPEGFHAVGQGRRFEAEKASSAATAVNLPARLDDRPLNVLTLKSADFSIGKQRSQGRGAGGGDGNVMGRAWTRERQRLVERQPSPIGQNDCSLDDMREFAHVSRPVVLLECSEVDRRQGRHRPVEPLARQSEEVGGQDGDVLLPIAKRGSSIGNKLNR